MKPGTRIALAILGTLGFGGWLVLGGGEDREIWIAIGGWLLGFWLASGIAAAERKGREDERALTRDVEPDDEEEEYDGDEYAEDDSDEEWEEEWDEEDEEPER